MSIEYKDLIHEIKNRVSEYIATEKNIDIESVDIYDQDNRALIINWFDSNFESYVAEKNEIATKKRQHHRFDVDIEIPISIVDTLIEQEVDPSQSGMIGEIINISRGGLYYKSVKPINVGSIIKVKIQLNNLDGNQNDVEALAMVKRVEPIENELFGIGLMFSSIYDEDLALLDHFMFNQIINLL